QPYWFSFTIFEAMQVISSNMKSLLMTAASILLTGLVVGNAYYQKRQFYPSVVYITKSNPSMAVLYIQAFVCVVLAGKLMRKIFFGQLRAAEMEHLIERSWYAVTETCLAFTVFRDDFSPRFVAMFTLLLFLKCFHWLGDDRVDYMERSPVITITFHLRVLSLLSLLGCLDMYFINLAYYSTLLKGASVQLVFGFEYAILLTVILTILVKYVLHTIDLQSENPWENKAVYLLYTELLTGFIKVILYMTFFIIMVKVHTFPLFAIRPMYLTMRQFKKALNDVIMSRRAIRNMNTLYPDATPEELQSGDNVCIICREEMVSGAKKLPCNHIFHASCLRSWFQRQQTCPTCRMDILRPTATRQNNQQAQPQQPPAQPQQPNMNGFPAPFPGFPQWPPQHPAQPPAAAAPPASTGPASPTSSTAATTSTPSTTSTTPSAAPIDPSFASFMPPPSFMMNPYMNMGSMPFGVAPPAPPPNFAGMTDDELHAMEGQERSNLEARIECLRNIQTLLDAAVIQMNQYSSIVSNLSSTPASFTATTSASSASSSATSSSRTPTTTSSSSTSKLSTSASSSGTLTSTPDLSLPKPLTTPEDEEFNRKHRSPKIDLPPAAKVAKQQSDSNSTIKDSNKPDTDIPSPEKQEQDEVRRRRLQRFQTENTPKDNLELD
ncbi:unnamed protein product, partial [Owenia fusiformis]